ncbi:MAG TPA: phenylacetate--CoA ligase [Candidatus Alistipes intestinipullorum]|nr:phenylacetate--CoA ligase [Candidatus Alistipes intestinipullorum]
MIWNKSKECMSRDEMSDLQGKRLHKLVELVYHNVPFYREKMQALDLTPEDINSIEDIRKLPFTTKQDLRDNYPTGLQAAHQSEIVRVHASSGTTGNPTIVGYTRRDLEIWKECSARALTAYGVTRNDVFSVGYGYGLFTGGLGAHYGVEYVGATVIPTSTGNTDKHLRLLRDLKITGIACTPSYALYLAEAMERNGMTRDDICLRIGAFGAEPWTENMREEIEARLGLQAYNLYGLSEIIGPGVSYECVCKNGSHIAEDHFYPEIINPDTLEPQPYGTTGELVFTTLTKTGMPLLRYRTKDLCSLIGEKCDCGRTNVRMTRIIGRSDDMLIIRGINVFPSQVESVILDMPEFEPVYMLVVDRVNSLDTLQVQVEVRKDFFSDDIGGMLQLRKKLADKLKSVLSISADVRLMEPNSIPRSEGKSVRVIDKRQLK